MKGLGFYPTYEALKQTRGKRACKGARRVFTLPMRHWNSQHSWFACDGMCVFTLPMRHWNKYLLMFISVQDQVFTLPMRHWNYHVSFLLENAHKRFYPTYEALKHNHIVENPKKFWCFYPTYEALKLAKATQIPSGRSRFYPTYEALKLKTLYSKGIEKIRFYPTYEALKPCWCCSRTWFSPQFLPYLWGIETAPDP